MLSNAFAAPLLQPSGRPIEQLAVTNVRVVDVVRGRTTEPQTVLIGNGVIEAVGPASKVKPPTGAVVIDGSGRFMVPGLWDMHVHLSVPASRPLDATMMVVNGVLYAREMSGDCVGEDCKRWTSIQEMRELQAAARAGQWLAPRITSIGSYMVHGPRAGFTRANRPHSPAYLVPRTNEEGRELAHYFKMRGVDFIKPYDTLPRDAYLGMTDEGKKIGIFVAGHVPKSVGLQEAIAAGQRSVEHARMLPLACSDVSEAYREAYAAWAISDEPQDQNLNVDDVNLPAWYKRILASQNRKKCDAVIASWVATGMYYVPTHLTRRAEAIVHTKPYAKDPRVAYIAAERVRDDWDDEAARYSALFKSDPAFQETYMQYFLVGLKLTARAYAAGVPVMVGTDTGDTLIYAGFSVHDELGLLVEAGLKPLDALRAATLVPAKYEGMLQQHGSIDAGKAGVFALLGADPLTDIGNTKHIVAVYSQGHYYDRAALDAVSKAVAANASAEQMHDGQ